MTTEPVLNILLSDMDGVLLDSHAYYDSLRDTMDSIGAALGFAPHVLSPEDILAFEGAGITAEWDSSVICTALLLDQLWQHYPDVSLDQALVGEPIPLHPIPLPDLAGFARRLGEDRTSEYRPLENAAALLAANANGRPPEKTALLVDLIHSARTPEYSWTYRLIQERNLGSRRFAESYGIPSVLDTESYLETRDRPTLSPEEQHALLGWAARPGSAAVIFTNRPALAPDGSGGLPEAEIGRRLTGLEDLPMMTMGGLGWLARQRGEGEEAYLKPSPVHVLAALQLALGASTLDALRSAAGLALDDRWDSSWRQLEGCQVIAVEDAAKGLRSATSALAILRGRGVQARLLLHGVATHPEKVRALEHAGAVVSPNVRLVLASLPGWLETPRA